MKSILQLDEEKCYLCGKDEGNDTLEWHHVFEGSWRKKSEDYGLKVKLHGYKCHRCGNNSVHLNEGINKRLKRKVQVFAMGYYGWSVEDWIDVFGKSYLNIEPRVKVESNIFDIVEEHHNCFVQILKNSQTGEVSFGWRPE